MYGLDAGRAWNDDMMFNFKYVMDTLGYTNVYETVNKCCPNTPASFLKKGRVNESDLCLMLAHAPNQEEAKELKEWLTTKTLKRALRPKPLHPGRRELRREAVERQRQRERASMWQPDPSTQYYFVDDDDPNATPRPVTVSTYPGQSLAPKDWWLPDNVDDEEEVCGWGTHRPSSKR